MKRWQKVTWLGLVLVMWVGVAWASGEGGAAHGDKVMNLVYRVINFILVAAILYKLAGKKAADFFSGRSRQIEEELKGLEQRRVQAEAKLQEVEQKIANLETEREQILRVAREQGEAIKAQIIEDAKRSAEQIKAQAKITAEQEAKAVFEQVKAEIAEKIVQAAEGLIKERLSEDIHRKLINEYLTKVVVN
ncbi:MAG: ATP synthase F0 subunit B [Desulfonauticus sp.]|nr:ATP synthase F0 subunit B [Desulfonauticus sp.]